MSTQYKKLIDYLMSGVPGVTWDQDDYAMVLPEGEPIPQSLCDRLNKLLEDCSELVHVVDIEPYNNSIHIQVLPLHLSTTCRNDSYFVKTGVAYRICNGKDVPLYRKYGVVHKKPDRVEQLITPATRNQTSYCYNAIFGFYDIADASVIQEVLCYEDPHIICFRIDDIEYWWDDLIMQRDPDCTVHSAISSNIMVAPERIEYIKKFTYEQAN